MSITFLIIPKSFPYFHCPSAMYVYEHNAGKMKIMSKPKMSEKRTGIMDVQDRDKLVKASQTAKQLVQDLSALLSSDNPLLADIAMDILEHAVQVELRIQRIESLDVICRTP